LRLLHMAVNNIQRTLTDMWPKMISFIL
jgi:hypothetical protein